MTPLRQAINPQRGMSPVKIPESCSCENGIMSTASQHAPLCRLIYVSRNLIPPARLGVELDAILASAHRNNTALGITGALIHNDSCFAQLLEGSEDAVQKVFEHIEADPRHAAACVIEIGVVPRRSFPQWAMARAGRLDETVTLMELLQPGFDKASGAQVISMLMSRFDEYAEIEVTRQSALSFHA